MPDAARPHAAQVDTAREAVALLHFAPSFT
jgi:hypothetical protein